jgi:hypothetical protein
MINGIPGKSQLFTFLHFGGSGGFGIGFIIIYI